MCQQCCNSSEWVVSNLKERTQYPELCLQPSFNEIRDDNRIQKGWNFYPHFPSKNVFLELNSPSLPLEIATAHFFWKIHKNCVTLESSPILFSSLKRIYLWMKIFKYIFLEMENLFIWDQKKLMSFGLLFLRKLMQSCMAHMQHLVRKNYFNP